MLFVGNLSSGSFAAKLLFFSPCSSLECSLPGIPRTTWAALHKRSKEVRRPFPVASYREFSFRLPVRVFPLISWVMLILWANFRTKANLRAGRCCWQVYLKGEAKDCVFSLLLSRNPKLAFGGSSSSFHGEGCAAFNSLK